MSNARDLRSLAITKIVADTLSDEMFDYVKGCPNLERLEISGDLSFTNAGLEHLKGCPRLSYLKIDGNVFIHNLGVTKNSFLIIFIIFYFYYFILFHIFFYYF